MGDSAVLLDEGAAREKLRSIWGHILGQDPSLIEDGDSFFDLGGDSILAHDVILAAGQQGLVLDMRTIFLSTSLEEMAEAVLLPPSNGNGTRKEEEEVPDQPPPNGTPGDDEAFADTTRLELARACRVSGADIEHVYPCSPMQESLMTDIDGHTNPYVIQCVFVLDENTSLPRFQLAWDETIRANPTLRTRICHADPAGSFVNVVVVDDKTAWGEETTDLAQSLDQDAALHMQPGEPFFRYCIVTSPALDRKEDQRYFVWTVHHALCDAASLETVITDVARRYQGEAVPEHHSFRQFVDSIHDATTVDRQREFWQRSLGDAEPAVYPPPRQDGELQPALTGSLEWPLVLSPTPRFGVTTAILLRAAWAILVSHYTGSKSVVFGVINNGRQTSALRDVVGPTINLVPALVAVDPDVAVPSFLTDILVRAAETMPFEHSGVSAVRKILADPGSAAAAAATQFRTLFVVQPADIFSGAADAMRILGLRYMKRLGKREKHPYPLVLTLTLSSDTLVNLHVQYDDRVLSKQAAEYLVHHYQRVLAELGEATQETRVGSISPFGDYDMSHIRRWNKARDPREPVCVHHLFQQQAAKQPKTVAVCSADLSLTYQDVDEMSTSLAIHLNQLGVAPGACVGVCFEKSVWTVVSILAVFKAGAVYVPIERGHPRPRIQEVIALAQIELVMTSVAGVGVLEGIKARTVLVGNGFQPRQFLDERHLLPTASPYSTAYVLFTSGTTGKPKGIIMPHASICASIKHHSAAFGMGPHSRTLQFGAHTFDLSIGEIFSTLSAGGCICVPSEQERLEDLAGAITRLRANTLLVVPTVLNLLSPPDVPTLETVVLAGEPIPQETVARWADKAELHCAYGPSETAVWCSGNLGVSTDADAANIGRGIGANMWIVEREDHRKLAAVGSVGEIVISGPLVGAGYLGDEAATAAAFVTAPDWLRAVDPTCGVVYRSGDLARYNYDGSMQIMGRMDAQVKIRGHRVELGEIESRVVEHGMVATAQAMVPATGPFEDQVVVVFSSQKPMLLQSAASASPDIRISEAGFALVQDLKLHAALSLPDYMLPSVWIPVEAAPLLVSGKMDRKRLRDWVQAMAYHDTHMELLRGMSDAGVVVDMAPGSAAETIRQLWSDVLGIPAHRIGMNTSFLAIGGDSIAAIQVVARCRKMGLQLSVRGLLGTKTLGSLSMLAEKAQITRVASPAEEEDNNTNERQTAEALLLPFRQSLQAKLGTESGYSIQDAYPLSPIQRVIMRARAADPSLFILSLTMELKPPDSQPVSLDRLVRAWEHTVAGFPILRSVFLRDSAQQKRDPIQVVLHGVRPIIHTVTAPQGDAIPTFDSEGVPSVDGCRFPHRALVFQRGGSYFISLEFDHLVIDGWSLQLVKMALMECYEADGLHTAAIHQPSPSYKSYVQAHSAVRTQADDKFWSAALRDQRASLLFLPATGKPHEPPPPEDQLDSAGTKTVLRLGCLRVESLASFSTSHGVTLASIFDAAWAQTLSHYTGSSDVAFDYVLSGRDDDDNDDNDDDVPSAFYIVGPLLNVLPYHLHGVSAEPGSNALAVLALRMQDQRIHDRLHARSDVAAVMESARPGERLWNTAVNFQRRPAKVGAGRWVVEEDLERTRDPWHVSEPDQKIGNSLSSL